MRDAELALDHTYAVMLLDNEEERLLLESNYDTDGMLIDVTFTVMRAKAISAEKLLKLKDTAEALRVRRIDKTKALGKIGRNQPCPCGSGKKYIKCCELR